MVGVPVAVGLAVGVEILGGPQPFQGESWYHVRLADGTTGWMLGDYLATLTPVPVGHATAVPLPSPTTPPPG
jgi:hypothetical protein